MKLLLAPVLWTAYIAMPVNGWGLLAGIPLEPPAIVSLSALWVAWSFRRPRWNALVPCALIVLKLAGMTVIAPRGFTARYYANDAANPPFEKSTDHSRSAWTRIDPVLDFGPAAARDLPLYFFNDATRFNWYRPGDPSRSALPYSVEWNGQLWAAADENVTMFLRGMGIRGRILLDGVLVITLDPDRDDARQPVHISQGWHQLELTVAAPYGAGRALYAGVIDASGRDLAFSDANVFERRLSTTRLDVDRVARIASVAIDCVMLLWMAFQACGALVAALASRSIRSVAGLFTVAAVIEALLFSRPWAGRLMLLSGGDDWLTYETYARDILLHGPLMTLGRPLGTGEAFYYQPLYPYVLAGWHWLFGEGFFGIVYTQRLLVAASVALVWRLTHVLFDVRIGLFGLVIALVVLYDRLGPWAPILLGEIVFIPLVCGWALCLIQLAEAGTVGRIVGTGILGGLATLSRSTLLLAWPLVATVLIAARVRHTRVRPSHGDDRTGPWPSVAPVLAAFAIMLPLVGLATARNWVVTHRFVPVTTTFSMDLLVGNRPPPGVTIQPESATAAQSLLARIAPNDDVRVVLEYARQAPGAFMRNLVNKGLYVLGFFGAYTDEGRPVPILITTWIAALLGAGLLVFAPLDTGVRGGARAVPGLIAISHFAALVLIFPHVYGDRLVLPFYALVLPYAAVAVSRIFSTILKLTTAASSLL